MKTLLCLILFLFLGLFSFSQTYLDSAGKSHTFKFIKSTPSQIKITQTLREGFNPSIFKLQSNYSLNAVVKKGQIVEFTITDSFGKQINFNSPKGVNINTGKIKIVCMHCDTYTREGKRWTICYDVPCNSNIVNAERYEDDQSK